MSQTQPYKENRRSFLKRAEYDIKELSFQCQLALFSSDKIMKEKDKEIREKLIDERQDCLNKMSFFLNKIRENLDIARHVLGD